MRRTSRHLLYLAGMLLSVPAAWGQEALLTKSAVQPAQGGLSARMQFRYLRYGDDPVGGFEQVDEFTTTAILTYGLNGELSLESRLPLSYRTYHGLGADGDAVALAGVGVATADAQAEADDSVEGGDGAAVVVVQQQRRSTAGAGLGQRQQGGEQGRGGTRGLPCHWRSPPGYRLAYQPLDRRPVTFADVDFLEPGIARRP